MFFPMQYNRVILGLIIAFLDFRIRYVDILPDFWGYILITMGLSELGEQHIYYEKAKKYSQVLILLSLPGIYMGSNSVIGFSTGQESIFYIFLLTVTAIVKLFMVYYVLRAAGQLWLGENSRYLFRLSDVFWKIYLCINAATIVLSVIKTNTVWWKGFLSILEAAWIVIEIALIALVYKTSTKFK